MIKAVILGKKESSNQLFEIYCNDIRVAISYGKIQVDEVKGYGLPYKFCLSAETTDGHTSFGYVDEVNDLRGG